MTDASVVAKWFLEEPHSQEARRLRDDYAADLLTIETPALLPYEVLNALHSSGVFDEEALKAAADALDGYGLQVRRLQGPLAESTVRLAAATGLTVYDASYVALTRDLGALLYSADEPLIRAAKEVVDARHIREYTV